MNQIKLEAPAKINLSLDVLGSRDDGFHEVEMIMQTIGLCDIIEISKIDQGIELTVIGADLPEDSNNLAYKAAELVFSQVNLATGVHIKIEKNIPVAAGLAGGSTDAAAVLRGMNSLFALDLTLKQLKRLASSLGSDVPFCLQGGTALATGRGTELTQLQDLKKENILLVNPGFSVSTPRIYEEFDRIKPDLDIPTQKLIEIINSRQEISWQEGWGNVLEPVTVKFFPEIVALKRRLSKYAVKFCLMSGSGPTVFAVLPDRKLGEEIIKDWPRPNDFLYLTVTRTQQKLEI
ncbi:MAG: 4-(cytidine 5'-diphospho)-2-C-methyl-D-erythritol kinase [bacterium]